MRLLPWLARACRVAVSLDACPAGDAEREAKREARRVRLAAPRRAPHRGARGTSAPGGAPMAGAALVCRSGPRGDARVIPAPQPRP